MAKDSMKLQSYKQIKDDHKTRHWKQNFEASTSIELPNPQIQEDTLYLLIFVN
jgi:hypothetical protein